MAEEKAPAAEAKKPEAKKKEGPTKRPSAKKRDLQSEKNRLRNRSYRSSVLTAIRSLEQSIEKKEGKDAVQSKLNAIYGLMDRGVKKRVYKPQKAARTKARLSSRASKI
ncbi:MAG: 30S ribosomal protein S20 [Chlamydiia bacterium]|nr:30S ribosomal protein S20 [Chlamydiia bacterium]